MSIVLYVILTIFIFGIIVLFHEFGHYIVAVACGVFIEEFAIGMGPILYSKKPNGTLYSIRILPLGGFCKMKGENANDKSQGSFNGLPVIKRIFIVLAGPIMNFFLALIIFCGYSLTNGIATPTIKSILENSPAQEVGLEEGDIIYKINNNKVHIYEDISYYISKYEGEVLSLEVKRTGEILKFDLTPVLKENNYIIGISLNVKNSILSKTSDEKVGFFEGIKNGYYKMIFLIKTTLSGLLDIITFKASSENIIGPIGLVSVVGESYETAISYSIKTVIRTMLNLIAILSVNIGLINLLPLPALDGGRFLFLLLELFLGKSISQEKEALIHLIGFVVLMILGVFIAFKDVLRIF